MQDTPIDPSEAREAAAARVLNIVMVALLLGGVVAFAGYQVVRQGLAYLHGDAAQGNGLEPSLRASMGFLVLGLVCLAHVVAKVWRGAQDRRSRKSV